jgi:DNA-directed RNA polymerase I, II, and III subunit RPABC1
MLILIPGIIFVFASVKMDITSKKWAEIIALNKHISMTVRDIASVVGVGKSSVSRTLCAYKDSGSLSPNRKGKCGRKRKTTRRTDQLLLRNSRLHPKMTSKDLQRDLLTSRIDIDASTLRCRLFEVRKQIEEQNFTAATKQRRLAWANTYRSWATDDCKKVVFCDGSHFLFKVTEQVLSDEAVINQ